MSDLEMTKLCAEAMDFFVGEHEPGLLRFFEKIGSANDIQWGNLYFPLTNNAQAMALLKKFAINVSAPLKACTTWRTVLIQVVEGETVGSIDAINEDLNRAIVECVAKMQSLR